MEYLAHSERSVAGIVGSPINQELLKYQISTLEIGYKQQIRKSSEVS